MTIGNSRAPLHHAKPLAPSSTRCWKCGAPIQKVSHFLQRRLYLATQLAKLPLVLETPRVRGGINVVAAVANGVEEVLRANGSSRPGICFLPVVGGAPSALPGPRPSYPHNACQR